MKTRRERLRDLLATREHGYSLEELREEFDTTRQALLEDLRHLQLSLRHREEELLMVPPACEGCGYTFNVETPKAPSKCPLCKSPSVEDPVFKVAADEG